MRRSICYSLLCFCLALNRTTAADTAPEVMVSQPVVREVTDYVDFTGRTQAVNSVNVVARVSGYLVKTPFQEGVERQGRGSALRDRSQALPGAVRSWP